jgi:hypothetical protein
MAVEIDRMRAEDEAYEERWREIWSETETGNAKTDGTDRT